MLFVSPMTQQTVETVSWGCMWTLQSTMVSMCTSPSISAVSAHPSVPWMSGSLSSRVKIVGLLVNHICLPHLVLFTRCFPTKYSWIFLISHACYMSLESHTLWVYYLGYSWWWVQIMKLQMLSSATDGSWNIEMFIHNRTLRFQRRLLDHRGDTNICACL